MFPLTARRLYRTNMVHVFCSVVLCIQKNLEEFVYWQQGFCTIAFLWCPLVPFITRHWCFGAFHHKKLVLHYKGNARHYTCLGIVFLIDLYFITETCLIPDSKTHIQSRFATFLLDHLSLCTLWSDTGIPNLSAGLSNMVISQFTAVVHPAA